MHPVIDKTNLLAYLSDIEKSLLERLFNETQTNINTSDAASDAANETANDSNQVGLYPFRVLLHEEAFNRLNQNTVQSKERVISLLCVHKENETQKSIAMSFYKSSFQYRENFTLVNNQITLKEVFRIEDALYVAGILSSFPGTSLAEPDNPINKPDGNLEDLPFSARRFFLENIILAQKPSEGFIFLDTIGCLSDILPEVAAGKNLSQNKYHKYDIYEHLLRSCDAMEVPDIVLRLSALLHDIGKVPTRRLKEDGEATFYNHEIISSHMLVSVMKRFGIPKAIGLKVKYYVRNHMFHYTDEWSDKAIRRFLRKVSREDLENLIMLRKADRIGSGKKNAFPKKLQKLIDHIDDVIMRDMELKVTDLDINGTDLMEMGLSEGPGIGKVLNQLLDEVKNEKTPNIRTEMIRRAQEIIALIMSEKTMENADSI